MADKLLSFGLAITVESVGTASQGEWDNLTHVSTLDATRIFEAVDAAERRSKLHKDRRVAVLSWTLERGTQVELVSIRGVTVLYYPSLLRDWPIRWNAVIAPVIEQHLSTYLRSQIPVEAPQGYSAEVDANADTDDAIESPFVGEIK